MFKQDANETPVIFRVSNYKDDCGAVTAVFPCEPHDVQGSGMTCYAHVGQHGACSFAWFHGRTHRPASPAEYADLKAELESAPYGYRLRVFKRRNRQHDKAFRAEIARLNQR